MDQLGDRMKKYEAQEAGRRLIPLLPVCARLDGIGFSKFTKGLKRPYDERMSDLMMTVTKSLVEGTGALIGYTQSDEISLVYYSASCDSQIFHDGRIQKMVSDLTAICVAQFTARLPHFIPEKSDKIVKFDCRVWNVPTLYEASNTLLWRELDATKNSISMAARHYYSHKELHKKNGSEMQEMLFKAGVNWNDYPAFFKRGTFFQRRKVLRKFTTEELETLPEKHEARTNPDLVIERSEVRKIDMPPFTKVVNRDAVVFEGADPIVGEDTCLEQS